MTNPFATSRQDLDRRDGADEIVGELHQFRKLRHLDDAEIAHRMVKSLAEVRKLRITFGRGRTRLREIGLNYRIRLLLGAQGMKTVADVQAKSDEELRTIPAIGTKRLAYIRETIREYLETPQ